MRRIQVIAHRGASAISPENTMIAFQRAIHIGADAIETDVQMTKDGHLVLIHDERVNRTTNGSGFVKDYTLNELRKLDAGSWFSSVYQNEKIPMIDEFFTLIKSTDIWVNVEIKNGYFMYPGIEEKLIGKIKEYDLLSRVVVSSFNHYSLLKIHQIAPYIKTAILYMTNLFEPWNYARMIGASSLHPYKKSLSKEIVDYAHQMGFTVYPFTVDDKEEMKNLIQMGVEGIMTNVPDRLILFIRELGGEA
ncbi:glycerophosphodiester phosphodiesterase [Tepidibacillus fermentans]|uniref:Glycerophosphoryl diester phosphodiesterase n=1 Tax=Tepidibacillus fermentans TaxID=1281767 RepID=A0A4R3KH83_9BACI|nr:glycerophosphodiester phosphodiesterase [Tepidibacillus fermentans]TCS82555.1 glycerophosphoryl diester phosphodiesterase [Tepidibacillus fermentans]